MALEIEGECIDPEVVELRSKISKLNGEIEYARADLQDVVNILHYKREANEDAKDVENTRVASMKIVNNIDDMIMEKLRLEEEIIHKKLFWGVNAVLLRRDTRKILQKLNIYYMHSLITLEETDLMKILPTKADIQELEEDINKIGFKLCTPLERFPSKSIIEIEEWRKDNKIIITAPWEKKKRGKR